MKTTKYKLNKSNIVLAGMIIDAAVCSRIASKWKEEGLFNSRWQNIVAGWTIKHLKKYHEPLGPQTVEARFQTWAAKSKSESTIKAMEKFLNQFDGIFCERVTAMSSEYILDLAGDVFEKIRLRGVVDLVETDLDVDNVRKASERLSRSLKIELGVGSLFRPGVDYERWRKAFEADQVQSLIKYPGKLGEYIGDDFCRDAFVSFLGATGVGKSFVLLDASFRGIRQHRRVAFFECGDMSESQFSRRMAQRALCRPKKDSTIQLPVDWEDTGIPVLKKDRRKGISLQEAFKAWKKVQRKRDLFRLSCHPNSSINIEGIDSILQEWIREGWLPDVVAIDYADILAPPSGVKELRDQIDITWRHMRRMSQEYHCLVLTATQADTESYDRVLITRRNFSNDRRKNDHVTGMIGLNSTHEEKELGISRWNWLKRRDDAYNEKKTVTIAGCLAIGCPVWISTF